MSDKVTDGRSDARPNTFFVINVPFSVYQSSFARREDAENALAELNDEDRLLLGYLMHTPGMITNDSLPDMARFMKFDPTDKLLKLISRFEEIGILYSDHLNAPNVWILTTKGIELGRLLPLLRTSEMLSQTG